MNSEPDFNIEAALREQVSAAPQLLRRYIHELEKRADPASNLRELVYAREEKTMLGMAIFELARAIRKHRDRQEPGRYGTHDLELYQAVDLSGGDSCPI